MSITPTPPFVQNAIFDFPHPLFFLGMLKDFKI